MAVLMRAGGVFLLIGPGIGASLCVMVITCKPGKGHAALRRGRVSLAGQVYFVTFTTRGRHRVFAGHECAMIAARAITDDRLWQDSQLLAWVLMPDHWHGLIRLGDGQDLSRLVRKLKANTARGLPGHPAPVWATAFHDHALRTDEDLAACARYLVMNPVRAGLVARVGDYPYWDAVWLQGRGLDDMGT